MKSIRFTVLFFAFLLTLRADQAYYWKSTPVDDSAQLITLFSQDVPLVSLLRDQLGTDEVSYVWLLTYSRPNLAQRALSAVPFFYWKVASGSTKARRADLKPLIKLNLPQRSAVPSSVRNIVQWTVLDPLSMEVRASTRAYQTNKHDHELLHLEEAKSYLQSAPTTYITEKERAAVIARLDFRKSLLGDFIDPSHAAKAGLNASLEQERIRAKNWELLRQCADKTGLIFEPLNLAGTSNQYAMLWLPAHSQPPVLGARLGPIWKLLNIKDPYAASQWPAERTPLGVYSLTYPKMPLLLIDFRDGLHLKRKELTQRAITEITSGIIGISRFTNWYYFVGADLYEFWASRRGTATNLQERLNSYSKFRVALALDTTLDPSLKSAMEKHVYSFSVNPLESSANNEFQAAIHRYELLRTHTAVLAARLDKDRRAELALVESTKAQQVRAEIFHYATAGLYTRRVQGGDFYDRLASYRQVSAGLAFLDQLSSAGTPPEVAYDSRRIQRTIAGINELLPGIDSKALRKRAETTLEKLQSLSADTQLKYQCVAALDSLRGTAAASTVREGMGPASALQ